MKTSGAAMVVHALEDEGVSFAFGIPGTHNIELYDALGQSERVRTILVTDEQSASFMADAVWRSSGKLACVNVVPGAGLTHAMSGIAEAFLDNVAMLVLGCGIRRDSGMGYQLHDVDQAAMVRPVVKGTFRPERGEEIYSTIRRACRLAREGAPGPVFVEIPADFYLISQESGGNGDSTGRTVPPAPSMQDVDRAAEILNRAKRPLLYFGQGAAGAGADLVRLAEMLQAPVATTFSGKGGVSERHPLWLWPGFGAAAPSFVRDIAQTCDATLAIGCRFGEVATGSYGMKPPSPLVHVDIDPAVIGRNYAPQIGVTSDAAAFVRALIPKLKARAVDGVLQRQIREGHEEVLKRWRDETGHERVAPSQLLERLQSRFGPETIYVTDSGNGTFIAMECLRLERPGQFLGPIDYSCMGYCVPAAIGAALASPGKPVIALAGDGALLMTGLELLTAAAQKVPVAVFVLRDGELAQIAQFQSVAYNRKGSSVLPDYNLEALCRGVGVEFHALTSPAGIDAALTAAGTALLESRPIVVEVAIDYSKKTYFTKGVVKTNLGRLPWRDRLRFIGRAVVRRVTG